MVPAFPYVEILFTAQKVTVNGEHLSILATLNCPQTSSDKIEFHLALRAYPKTPAALKATIAEIRWRKAS